MDGAGMLLRRLAVIQVAMSRNIADEIRASQTHPKQCQHVVCSAFAKPLPIEALLCLILRCSPVVLLHPSSLFLPFLFLLLFPSHCKPIQQQCICSARKRRSHLGATFGHLGPSDRSRNSPSRPSGGFEGKVPLPGREDGGRTREAP